MRTPIVFIHGLFGEFAEQETFHELFPAACSAPHLAGYGPNAGDAIALYGQLQELHAAVRDAANGGPAHLVAHSCGGVLAFVFALRYPELVASLTSVEGNFSTADGFSSFQLSAMGRAAARAEISARFTDPERFLASDGIAPTAVCLRRAAQALAYQPWETVWETAKLVTRVTSKPSYTTTLQQVFRNRPVHLVAGERSQRKWHVPLWAQSQCRSMTTMPQVGHMMMLEKPTELGRTLRSVIAVGTPGAPRTVPVDDQTSAKEPAASLAASRTSVGLRAPTTLVTC